MASVLRNYKNIKKVRVEGHTDNKGSKKSNLALSTARAASVRAYLVGKGIDSSRLASEGFGPDKPIASNATNKGREINRRVEFIIVEMKPIGKDVSENQPAPPPPPTQDKGFEIELPDTQKAPPTAPPAPKQEPKKSDAPPVELQF